ncbi:MAG: ABC transporter permease, partial [Planctomycetota bacterium]|nr:ABC transporter permease [Planctomycetota bacterium]
MYAYIVRRLFIGLLIVWGVYTITFLAVNLAPGDPFTGKESAKVTEADLDRLRAKWGYDLPVWRRYFLHIRKMFYADPEVLDFEGGGLRFDVSGADDGNVVSVSVQDPPDEILLQPSTESMQDWGSEPQTLTRAPDGTYPAKPLKEGQYRFGLRKLSAFSADVDLDSAGVLIHYDAETRMVSAKPTLASPPERIRLVSTKGEGKAIEIVRAADGTYPTVKAPSGRYVHEGGNADLLVPEETLETGGPTFDLGTSIQHNQPVFDYLRPKFWNTMKLAFWALFFNYLIGIGLGVSTAVRQHTSFDHGVTVSAFFLYSMPGFWLGLMLQLLFAVHLGLLPIHGMGDGSFLNALEHYAMPVFVLGVAGAAGTARYQRSAVLEVLSEDYVRTARAKGLDEGVVIRKHVLRNSLLPIITLFGLSMPFLVSGAVITEEIFSWPGIGSAAIG